MRYWVGVGAGTGVGLIVGFIAGMAAIEKKVRDEYTEANASYRRALEMARDIAEKDEKIDAKLVGGPKLPEEVIAPEDETIMEPEVRTVNIFEDAEEMKERIEYDPRESVGYQPSNDNPYHESLSSVEDGEKHFTYLEEEDYMDEEDGFAKRQITVLMDESNPIFLEEGAEIRDWDEKIGVNILRDFYTMVGPDQPQVMWVRNHQTGTDYEVIKDLP